MISIIENLFGSNFSMNIKQIEGDLYDSPIYQQFGFGELEECMKAIFEAIVTLHKWTAKINLKSLKRIKYTCSIIKSLY